MKIKLFDKYKPIEFNALNIVEKTQEGLSNAVQREIKNVCREIDRSASQGYNELSHSIIGPIEVYPFVVDFLKEKGFFAKALPQHSCGMFTNITRLEIKWGKHENKI